MEMSGVCYLDANNMKAAYLAALILQQIQHERLSPSVLEAQWRPVVLYSHNSTLTDPPEVESIIQHPTLLLEYTPHHLYSSANNLASDCDFCHCKFKKLKTSFIETFTLRGCVCVCVCVCVCLAVTCHIHFWQNNQNLLHATVLTVG